MSGIVGSRLNIRGSGIVGGIGTDGQVLTSSGAGQEMVFEDAGGGAVSAINNATANELVSIGATTTELEAEAKLLFSSAALTIGNATAEDTKIVFDGNAKDFYIGLDDSADKLVIGEGSTVGTNNILTIEDDAITIGDAAAVDPKLIFDGNAQDYYVGIDDSNDKFEIGLGTAVGTTAYEVITPEGIVSNPYNPAFAVRTGTEMYVDISGNQTIPFDTEHFDNNADFNTGTYKFTAPVTGKYLLVYCIAMVSPQDESNAAQQYSVTVVTSNKSYLIFAFRHDVDQTFLLDRMSVIADMDAGDTAHLTIYMRNGTASVSKLEATDFTRQMFFGSLIA
jgi:hypothetical protein